MTEKKENGFMDIIKDLISNLSHKILGNLIVPIIDSTEIIVHNIENKIQKIQTSIIRKISYFLIIIFGAILLIFSLIFYLIEYLKWSKSLAYFSIGITIVVIGIILKIKDMFIEKK